MKEPNRLTFCLVIMSTCQAIQLISARVWTTATPLWIHKRGENRETKPTSHWKEKKEKRIKSNSRNTVLKFQSTILQCSIPHSSGAHRCLELWHPIYKSHQHMERSTSLHISCTHFLERETLLSMAQVEWDCYPAGACEPTLEYSKVIAPIIHWDTLC